MDILILDISVLKWCIVGHGMGALWDVSISALHVFCAENTSIKQLLSYRCPIIRSLVVALIMMTSSNGSIFCVTGPLCGEFSGHRGIPLTKASNAELWWFLWSVSEQTLSKQSRRRWLEMPLHSLWRTVMVPCYRQGHQRLRYLT